MTNNYDKTQIALKTPNEKDFVKISLWPPQNNFEINSIPNGGFQVKIVCGESTINIEIGTDEKPQATNFNETSLQEQPIIDFEIFDDNEIKKDLETNQLNNNSNINCLDMAHSNSLKILEPLKHHTEEPQLLLNNIKEPEQLALELTTDTPVLATQQMDDSKVLLLNQAYDNSNLQIQSYEDASYNISEDSNYQLQQKKIALTNNTNEILMEHKIQDINNSPQADKSDFLSLIIDESKLNPSESLIKYIQDTRYPQLSIKSPIKSPENHVFDISDSLNPNDATTLIVEVLKDEMGYETYTHIPEYNEEDLDIDLVQLREDGANELYVKGIGNIGNKKTNSKFKHLAKGLKKAENA